MCFTGRERESRHLRPPLSALLSPPLVLFPTANDMRSKRVWSVFFFRSDFISLCERLYFMTSLHFLFVFCSYCILLQLVAVEIKAGFFFFFWVLILLVYEKDCILKFYCIFVCVFVQIVCNNFTYERRVACICSLWWVASEGVKKKEKKYFTYDKVSTRSVIQDAQRKSPKLTKCQQGQWYKMHRCRHPNGSNGSSAYVSAIRVPFNKAVLLQIRLYIDCSMKFPDHSFLNPHVSIFLAKSGAILPFRIHSLNLQKTRFMCIIFAA